LQETTRFLTEIELNLEKEIKKIIITGKIIYYMVGIFQRTILNTIQHNNNGHCKCTEINKELAQRAYALNKIH